MIMKVAQVVLTVLVVFCTVQSLFWPIIMKPGTEFYWWQIEHAAKVGYYLGFPVILIATKLQLGEGWHHLIVWISVFIWGVLVYSMVGLVSRLFLKIHQNVE